MSSSITTSTVVLTFYAVATSLKVAVSFSTFHSRSFPITVTPKPWEKANAFGLIRSNRNSLSTFVGHYGGSNDTTVDSDLGIRNVFVEPYENNDVSSGRKDNEIISDELFADLKDQAEKLELLESILAASKDNVVVAESSIPEMVERELNIGYSALRGGSNGTEMTTTEFFPPLAMVDEQSTIATVKTKTALDPLPEIAPVIIYDTDLMTKQQDSIEAPSLPKILKFAVPAMGVWLCSPLLSMIDTSAVGMLAGTVHQAALNPAVAVTDYAALCIAFLYAATTNMVAAARETEKTVSAKPQTTKSLLGAMQLSSYVGIGLGAILFLFAKQLLKGIIGNDAVDPAVFASAMKYVRIRALGMPAAAIIGSAQAACLGMQDISSPMYVLLAAAIVNFFGDMIFVGSTNPIIGGAAGAAWATVFSQYAAVALFMRWLCNKPKSENESKTKVMNLTTPIMELTGGQNSNGVGRRRKSRHSIMARLRSFNQFVREDDTVITQRPGITKTLLRRVMTPQCEFVAASNEITPKKERQPKYELSTVRGLLAGQAGAKDLLKLPPKDVAKKFVPYILPVTTTQVGRVSGFVAMNHVASSVLGTTSMAAQQILLSLFYCLCPIPDSLNLTAQSFVPGICEKKASKQRSRALAKTTTRFLYSGAALSVLTVGIVGLIPFLSRFFTSDPAVMSLVNVGAPYLALFFSVHGLMCASEGLLLGQKDLGFLGKMYGSFFVAVPYFMLRVKHAGLAGTKLVSLESVWQVFVGYQLVRAAAWTARVIMLRQKTNKEASILSEDNDCNARLYQGLAP